MFLIINVRLRKQYQIVHATESLGGLRLMLSVLNGLVSRSWHYKASEECICRFWWCLSGGNQLLHMGLY